MGNPKEEKHNKPEQQGGSCSTEHQADTSKTKGRDEAKGHEKNKGQKAGHFQGETKEFTEGGGFGKHEGLNRGAGQVGSKGLDPHGKKQTESGAPEEHQDQNPPRKEKDKTTAGPTEKSGVK